MGKKIITHSNGVVETRETFYTEETVNQLKQQLVEKDKEIKKLNWQLKDKDFIIKNLNHSLSVAPNANAGQRARIDELTKIVKEKDKEIERLKERLSVFDNFKDNYGYTNYDDSEILEDLQSRAFQGEDDTAVIESLFDFFDICDENEILPKVEEISEKLKCAIVPKFKIGQEIYSVGYLDIQSWVVDRIELGIIDGELCEIYRLGHIGTDDYNCCILPQDNEKFYATLEEAQAKLQELRGEE